MSAARTGAERPGRVCTTVGSTNSKCTCLLGCSKDTWKAGRGGGGNWEKSEERDKKSLVKAQKQGRPAFLEEAMKESGADSLEDFVKGVEGLTEDESASVLLYASHMKHFEASEQLNNLFKAICDRHEPRGEWQVIETKSTTVLEDIHRLRTDCGVEKKRCYELKLLASSERNAYFNRAHGRIGLGNTHGAIEDLTEALAVQQTFYSGKDGEVGSEFDVEILYHRGTCHLKLDNLDEAIRDLRGACSGLRVIGDDWGGKIDIPLNVVMSYLIAMGKQQLQSGCQRPLYSRIERDSIEKSLGLNTYYGPNYQCFFNAVSLLGMSNSSNVLVVIKCGSVTQNVSSSHGRMTTDIGMSASSRWALLLFKTMIELQ